MPLGLSLVTLERCSKLWRHSLTTLEASNYDHNMLMVQTTVKLKTESKVFREIG
jgi:hypothetical protein